VLYTKCNRSAGRRRSIRLEHSVSGMDSLIGQAIIVLSAPVAQLDRANASGALGREFESLRARQYLNLLLLEPILIWK
jgi:hypothetical protein